jgi:hypothetical protein
MRMMDGSSLTMDGVAFYGRDGYYQWQTTSSGWYITLRLYVSSPTQMAADYALAPIGI